MSDASQRCADEVTACPECDSTRIRPHVGESVAGRAGSGREWSCSECNALFDDPIERDKHRDGGPTRGLAADLAAADPEEAQR